MRLLTGGVGARGNRPRNAEIGAIAMEPDYPGMGDERLGHPLPGPSVGVAYHDPPGQLDLAPV